MQYTKPKFSVPMPGDKVDWPFKRRGNVDFEHYEQCDACGGMAWTDPETGFRRAHEHPDDAGRPRRRVCFGR